MTTRKYKIEWSLPSFEQYIKPYGVLEAHPACLMLFHYALTARLVYEQQIDTIVLEGEIDPEYRYRELFKGLAIAWGIEPEIAIKFWPEVDCQLTMLRLPHLPIELKFKSTPSVVTTVKN